MPIDPSISLNQPQGEKFSLSSMLANANAIQQFRAGQLELQKARALLQPQIEQGQAASRQAIAEANVAEGSQQARIDQQNIAAHQAQFTLDKDQMGYGMQVAGGLLSDPDVQALADPKIANDPERLAQLSGSIMGKLADAQNYMEQAGVPRTKVLAAFGPLASAITHDPAKVPGMLRNITMAGIPASAQGTAATPSGIGVNNNQQFKTVNTNPLAPTPVGEAIPGTTGEVKLPPTTTVVRPGENAPSYLGAGGRGGPQAGFQLGQPENVGGTVGVVNEDWKTTAGEASKAQQDISLLQNIKRFSHGAATGVGAERRAFLSGLAGMMGVQLGEDEKTNTDLLTKNANILAGSGGNTDAARALASVSNPNVHMTEAAINEAADQLIAQRRMSLAKQDYLGKFKGDPNSYKDHLAIWNKNADPRALQFESMGHDEQVQMLRGMSKSERANLRSKIQFFQSLGAIK